MKKTTGKKSEKTILFLFFTLTLIGRVLLGSCVSIWFPAAQRADDLQMIIYAFLGEHFANPASDSLVKTMGYPVFLYAVFRSHIPYAVVVSAIWWFCGVLGFYAAKLLCRSRLLPFTAALYLMFLPSAFELWCGTRLYRNSVIAPFSLLVFLLMIHLFLRCFVKASPFRGNMFLSLCLGILFCFTYYLKEDGLWLFACVIFWALLGVFAAIRRRLKKSALLFILPILVFLSGSLAYRAVNYHFFGVFEINTRTSGEPGNFCKWIYKIDSPDRTAEIWAPYDAIQKACEASETFSSHPELLQSIHDTFWFEGNVELHPIRGDFLGWVLRSSLEECGLWESEKQINDLFRQINRELKTAFQKGTLTASKTRYQLLPSAGGRNFKEILALFPLIKDAVRGAVFLDGYTAGIMEVSGEDLTNNAFFVDAARTMTHTPTLNRLDPNTPSYVAAVGIVRILFVCYRIVNTVLFLLLVLTCLENAIKILAHIRHISQYLARSPKFFVQTAVAGLFLGIGLLYAFSIGWFSSFLFQDGVNLRILNFYNIALPVLFAMAYLFLVTALWDRFFTK